MNEDKFTGKAAVYTKYRPTYPDSFLEYLFRELGFHHNSVTADIGSGTGILTGLLLKRGCTVYGVEPNEDMRKTAEKALSHFERFHSVNASAEHTGLPDTCVDAVTAAQSFHWFDRAKFKAECQRILRENGTVVLVWNSRDAESELVQENDAVNHRFCPNFKGFSGGMRGDDPNGFRDFFKNGIYEYKIFEHTLSVDEKGFIGGNLSASYAPKPADNNYNPYISALKQVFEKYNDSGILRIPFFTGSYAGRV